MKTLLNCGAIKTACRRAQEAIEAQEAAIKPPSPWERFFAGFYGPGLSRLETAGKRRRIAMLDGIASHKSGQLIEVESPHLDDIAPFLEPHVSERI